MFSKFTSILSDIVSVLKNNYRIRGNVYRGNLGLEPLENPHHPSKEYVENGATKHKDGDTIVVTTAEKIQ